MDKKKTTYDVTITYSKQHINYVNLSVNRWKNATNEDTNLLSILCDFSITRACPINHWTELSPPKYIFTQWYNIIKYNITK